MGVGLRVGSSHGNCNLGQMEYSHLDFSVSNPDSFSEPHYVSLTHSAKAKRTRSPHWGQPLEIRSRLIVNPTGTASQSLFLPVSGIQYPDKASEDWRRYSMWTLVYFRECETEFKSTWTNYMDKLIITSTSTQHKKSFYSISMGENICKKNRNWLRRTECTRWSQV